MFIEDLVMMSMMSL